MDFCSNEMKVKVLLAALNEDDSLTRAYLHDFNDTLEKLFLNMTDFKFLYGL